MIATRRPFNGTFILLLGIHQKFTDSGVKQSFSFTLYIKILKNRGNIGYSFFVFISPICPEKAIPCKFIRIRMFIDRMTIGIITLNFIPLHMAIHPGFYTYVVMQSKTVVKTYAPNAVRCMGLRQTSGSSNIPLVFFNDTNSFKTDIQRMDGNEKLCGNSMCRISIPGESHICRRNAFNHSSQSFMFRSKMFRKNNVKFDRAGEGRSPDCWICSLLAQGFIRNLAFSVVSSVFKPSSSNSFPSITFH